MIVVSDTSCISNLITIGHDRLLADLFTEVSIPPAVHRELMRFHSGLPEFVQIRKPQRTEYIATLSQELDIGEAEAISLTKELNADRLLIDEKRGRAIALRERVPIIGLVGILLVGKDKKFITSVGNLLDRLEREAGFRLSFDVRNAALQAAKEKP